MSFPRYPAYKDSGVEWLGEVPEHWGVVKLKFLATVQTGVAKGKNNSGKTVVDVAYLRVANVQNGYLDLDEVATIEIPQDDLDRYLLRPGDVLMNEGGDNDKLGRGHIWSGEVSPCIHQNHVFAVRPIKLSSDWLNRVTGSSYAQFYFMSRSKQSTNLASISSTNIMELPVILPPDIEQVIIGTFLDRETAKIDALVSDYRTLIELLQEKRQAVISHAVIKGLDSMAPMKDSGVEWLGEVPEHWEIVRLKWISSQITVGIVVEPSKYYVQDRGVPALRSLNIQPGRIDLENVIQISEEANDELEKSRLIEGDLVAVRSGQPGTMAVVPKGMSGFNCIDLIIIRRSAKIESEYLCWYMNSNPAQRQFLEGSGGAIQKHFNIGTALNLLVVRPPSDEQRRIMSFLQCSTRELDCLITDAEDAITLLQERRSALISAAVTGKIDVRGLVETEVA